MKKHILICFVAIYVLLTLISQFCLGAAAEQKVAFEFKKTAINDVVAKELNVPAKFNLTITNHNIYDDYFQVYSLVDLKISPITSFLIPAGQQKTIEMKALPSGWLKNKGTYSVEYYIKSEKSGYLTDTVIIKVLPLSEILTIKMPSSITRDDNKIEITIINDENIDLGETQLFLNSDIFSATKNITIAPKSSQTVALDLDSNEIKLKKAGTYEVKTTLFLNKEYNYTTESDIKLEEFSSITTTESSKFGFFSFVKTITKKNNGNVPKLVSIEITKSRFERFFSSFNVQPTSEKASFMLTTLSWDRELQPGESFTLEVKTNYTIFVVILIILIILIVALYLAKRPRVIVRKKSTKLITKGGEFALKVIVFIKNVGKEIQNVSLVDRLPHVAKLYERFTVKPDKIEGNKLEWNFGSLAPNEERVVSYIIYSKVTPIGTIELPQATVHYTDSKNRRKFINSNKLFVLSS